ncbi:MAG: M1 family aminopeptidase, partial [Aestuariivirga sp.]
RWWDDLWLNESFATLLESKFSNLVESRWHFSTDILLHSHGAMALDLLPSVRRIHEPVLNEDGISTAFDSITYEKGSVVLAMVEDVLGEAGFRKFISDMLKARKFDTYDTAGFVAELRTVPKGAEAADLLLSLIDHTGLPIVNDVLQAFPNDAVPRYQRARMTETQWLQKCKQAVGSPLPQALAIAIGFDISLYTREISLAAYLSGVRDLAKHAMWEVAGLALENLQFIILEMPSDQHVKKFAAEVFGPMFAGATSTIDMVVQWQMEKQEADLAEFFALTRSDDKIFRQLMADGLKLLKDDDPFESVYPQARLAPALMAAGQSHEEWVLPRILTHLGKADDVHHRSHLIEALCACRGPKVDAVLEEMLQGDALLTHELTELLDCRARFPEFRVALWAMISRNAGLLLKRLDGDSEVALIQVADAFADIKFVDEVQATIVPLLGHLRGGVPQLALTQDKIRLNAGLLDHLRQEATP